MRKRSVKSGARSLTSSGVYSVADDDDDVQNEKATRQLGGLFFKGE